MMPMQTFSRHILHFLADKSRDWTLFDFCKELTVLIFSLKHYRRFYPMDVERPLLVDCTAIKLLVKNFWLGPSCFGWAVSHLQRSVVEQVLSTTMGFLVMKICVFGSTPQTFGEHFTAVSSEVFKKLANKLSEGKMDHFHVDHSVCKAPAPFCDMTFLNSAYYISSDDAEKSNTLKGWIRTMCSFIILALHTQEIILRFSLVLHALRNFEDREKLYLDSRSWYIFADVYSKMV